MEFEILARLAERGSYYKLQTINFDTLSNILIFPEEVFAYIDDVRIVFLREDYEQCIAKYIDDKNVTGNPI